MSTITTRDGTEIYYKDWGAGAAGTRSHGWPLSADAWDGQMMFLAQHGFRAVAHDRRGHGRSSQPSAGNGGGLELGDSPLTCDRHVGHVSNRARPQWTESQPARNKRTGDLRSRHSR